MWSQTYEFTALEQMFLFYFFLRFFFVAQQKKNWRADWIVQQWLNLKRYPASLPQDAPPSYSAAFDNSSAMKCLTLTALEKIAYRK